MGVRMAGRVPDFSASVQDLADQPRSTNTILLCVEWVSMAQCRHMGFQQAAIGGAPLLVEAPAISL